MEPERHHRVEGVPPAGSLVSSDRQVGDQRHVNEQRAGRQIRENRARVPDERRPHVRPDAAREVVGHEPVHETPRAPRVNQREDRRRGEREHGQHFGGAGHGAPPFRLAQAKNGRNHHTGVADADPEDEVGNQDRPVRGVVVAERLQSDDHHKGEGDKAGPEEHAEHRGREPEPQRRMEREAKQVPVDLRRGQIKPFLHAVSPHRGFATTATWVRMYGCSTLSSNPSCVSHIETPGTTRSANR